jgi:hypothetical protein
LYESEQTCMHISRNIVCIFVRMMKVIVGLIISSGEFCIPRWRGHCQILIQLHLGWYWILRLVLGYMFLVRFFKETHVGFCFTGTCIKIFFY